MASGKRFWSLFWEILAWVTAKVVLCGGFSRKLAVKESRGSRDSADITAKSILCVFFSRNHAKKMTQNKA